MVNDSNPIGSKGCWFEALLAGHAAAAGHVGELGLER